MLHGAFSRTITVEPSLAFTSHGCKSIGFAIVTGGTRVTVYEGSNTGSRSKCTTWTRLRRGWASNTVMPNRTNVPCEVASGCWWWRCCDAVVALETVGCGGRECYAVAVLAAWARDALGEASETGHITEGSWGCQYGYFMDSRKLFQNTKNNYWIANLEDSPQQQYLTQHSRSPWDKEAALPFPKSDR